MADALDQLLELTWKLVDPLPLERGLKLVSDMALVIVPADHASVRLLDDRGRELSVWARSGIGADAPAAPFRPGEGVSGWVCKTGRAARIADVLKDRRFKPQTGQGF
ncbi:MAG TPA: hypothetical protein VFB62_18375, partial [Polyangiaceae bacterium]|nr:hypothetical protein [Polyangiaceae bacterium]